MAYIINTSGDSGYTRADFVNALGGKQDKLVSGTNIRTVGGWSVIGSGNLDFDQEYTYDLSDADIALRDDAIARINHIKSLCSSNGISHDVMVFGLISDLHTAPSKEEILADNTVPQEIKDAWPSSGAYFGGSAEGSVRLLGAICYSIGADAVFCGGDMSSGGGLSKDLYGYMLGRMKSMFDKYISVPHFITDGNHDIKYNSSVPVRGNAEWLAYIKQFNTPGNYSTHSVKYLENENQDVDGYTSTSYCVDFSNHKVRAFMASKYEAIESSGSSAAHGGTGGPSHNNTFCAFAMDNPADSENWTVMRFTHNCTERSPEGALTYYINMFLSGEDFSTSGASAGSGLKTRTNPNMVNGVRHKGKAYVGSLGGHWHDNREFLTSNGKLSGLSINTCTSKRSRVFSMFVLDTTAFKLYEIKVGTQWTSYSGNNFHSDASVSEYGWFEYDIRHE